MKTVSFHFVTKAVLTIDRQPTNFGLNVKNWTQISFSFGNKLQDGRDIKWVT